MTPSAPVLERDALAVGERSVQRQPQSVSASRRVPTDGPVDADSARLVVKRDGGVTLLPIQEIECLEASGNFVIVHACDQQRYHIREPLAHLFEQLSPYGFIRIHRSTVVRVNAIAGVDKGRYRKAFAVLRTGAKYEIGRVEFQRLRSLWQPGVLDLEALSRGLRLVPVAR